MLWCFGGADNERRDRNTTLEEECRGATRHDLEEDCRGDKRNVQAVGSRPLVPTARFRQQDFV
jgi:hypothetical protein